MFTIQCPTCQAKLKVSKVELIGQTLACPRCAVMVQIVPPAEWKPPESVAETTGESTGKSAGKTADGASRKSAEKSAGRSVNERGKPAAPAAPAAKQFRPAKKEGPSSQPVDPADQAPDMQETKPVESSAQWSADAAAGLASPADRPAGQARAKPSGSVSTRDSSKGPPPGKLPRTTSQAALTQAEQWDSQRTRQRRKVLLVAIAAVGALATFGAVGAYWWEQRSRFAQLDQPLRDPVEDGQNGALEPRPNGDGQPDADPGLGPNEVDPPRLANEDGETPPADPGPQGAAGDHDLERPLAPGDLPSVTGNESAMPPNAAPGDLPTPGAAATGEGESLVPAIGNGDGEVADIVGLGGNSSEASFQDVMSDIFGAEELSSDWDDPELRAMQQNASDPIDQVLRDLAMQQPARARSGRVNRPSARQVDIQRSLNSRIAGMRNPDMRLPEFLAILEQLSSVPIWIDIHRYQANPLPLDVRQPIEGVQLTVPEMLDQHLESFGFAFERHAWNPNLPELEGLRVFPAGTGDLVQRQYQIAWLPNEIVADPGQQADLAAPQDGAAERPGENPQDRADGGPARRPGSPLDPPPPPAPVDNQPAANPARPPADQLPAGLEPDLVADPAAEAVADLIRRYIYPQTWVPIEQIQGGQLPPARGLIQVQARQLDVIHYPHVHRKIERFLQQLQLAREHQGRGAGWPDSLQPLAVQGGQSLAAVVDLEYQQPVAIQSLLRRLHEQAGVTVLLDWPTLIQEGWTPDTAIPLVVRNATVAETLREICLDMGLNYRVLAPDVVALRSDASEKYELDVEVYPVADLVSGPRDWPIFRSRLKRLLEQDLTRFDTAYVYYEPEFGSLIASLPQSSHRRLTLYLETARERP